MAEWSIEEVGDWLRHLGLDEYIERFKKNHINGSVLFDITEADLKDEFKMMSVGHRKNFMKAIGNLKKIFCGSSGKNSEYIRQKIHKFYEKNKQKNAKMGLLNSLGSDSKFYSHRFYTKNFYSGQNQIIEEDDEHSVKFETNPSPVINAKNDPEHIESIVLSERRKSGSDDQKNSQPEFEIDEDIIQAQQKAASRDDVGSHRDIDHSHSHSKLAVDTKGPYVKQNSDQRGGNKQTSDSKANSPLKKDTASEKQPSNEDTSKSDNNVQQQQQQQQQTKNEKNEKNEKHDLNSPESSSESSSSSDSSDDEKAPKKPEPNKEDQLVVDLAASKVAKPEQKNEKKMHKKNTSTAANNFKSAEFTTKAKNPYKEGQKVKKRHRQHKKGGKYILLYHIKFFVDLEDINQKISNNGSHINTNILIEDDIIRKFRESGLNENFIINYNELFFEKKIGEGGIAFIIY